MANWAIVIGVDRYAIAEAALHGAVADALEMRKWLLDPTGGNVPEDNLALVLGPAVGAPAPNVPFIEPERSAVTKRILELVQTSGGQGDRLYFYFAGHGLSVRRDASYEDTMLFADFDWVTPDNSWSLQSLWDYFATLEFQDQFLFVDACRNAPRVEDMIMGRWPRPGRRQLGTAPVQHFILYATSPGLRAAETGAVGKEHGAFTQTLLAGLRGTGQAKAWDSASGVYRIRWEPLAAYVVQAMDASRIGVPDSAAPDAFQVPQMAGTRGVAGRESNPVVTTIASDKVPDGKRKLDVMVAPSAALSVAEVLLLDDAGEELERRKQIATLPVRFEREPRTYLVHARAPAYANAVCRPPVDLYADKTIKLELQRAAPAPEIEKGLRKNGRLVAQCPDPLAYIEILDSSGKRRKSGRGNTEAVLAPGAYRAVLRNPDGTSVERAVEVHARNRETLTFEMPPPGGPVEALIERSALEPHADRTVAISEAMPSVADLTLSALLALAGGATMFGGTEMGHKLRSLGARALESVLDTQTGCAAHVLVGVEADDEATAERRLREQELRIWRADQPVPYDRILLAPFSPLAGLGEHAQEADVGLHWLTLSTPGAPAVVHVLPILRDRITLAVIHVAADGSRRFSLFMPPRNGTPEEVLPTLREVELTERFATSHWLYAGEEVARELATMHNPGPVASVLGAYLLLRLGHFDALGDTTAALVTAFPDLSDVHVLRAEYEASLGHTAAAEDSIALAVAAGLPTFGEGVARLLDGLGQFGNSHANGGLLADVHARYDLDSLFTAWTPPALNPGELLTG